MPRALPPGSERNVHRAYFALTSIADLTIEIANPAASGFTLQLLRYKIYSLAANQVKIQRNSAVATGGTSTALTPSDERTDSAAVATGKKWSVAKTGGATLAQSWDIHELAAAATYDSGPKSEMETGLVIAQGEQLGLYFSAATTVEGFIEWAEDPV